MSLASCRPQCSHLPACHAQLAPWLHVARGGGHHADDANIHLAGTVWARREAMTRPAVTSHEARAVALYRELLGSLLPCLSLWGSAVRPVVQSVCPPGLHLLHSPKVLQLSPSTVWRVPVVSAVSVSSDSSPVPAAARTALTIRPAASEAEIAVRPSREVYRKMTCETTVASLAASPACPASASLQLVPSPTRRHAKTAAGHQCQMCSAPASPSPQSGHAP